MAKRSTASRTKRLDVTKGVYGPNYSQKEAEWKKRVQEIYKQYMSDLKKLGEEAGIKLNERKIPKSFELKKGVQKISYSKKGRKPAYFVEVDEEKAREWLEKYPRKVSEIAPGSQEGTVLLKVDVVKRSKTGYVDEVLKKIEEGEVKKIREIEKVGKGPEMIRVMVTKEQLSILKQKYSSLDVNVVGEYAKSGAGTGVLIVDIPTRSSSGTRNEAFIDVVLDAIAKGEMMPLAHVSQRSVKKRIEREAGEAGPEGAAPMPTEGSGGGEAEEQVIKEEKKKGVKVKVVKHNIRYEEIIPPWLLKLLLILILIALVYGVVNSIFRW